MIRLDSIKKSFRDQVLFDGLSLHVKSGVRLGIIGPNGSGKTTLFNIIRGTETVDAGNFSIRKDVTIGFVEQEIENLHGRSVLEETLSVFPRILHLEKNIVKMYEKLSHHPHDTSFIHELADLQDEYEKKRGYSYENQAKIILSGLGFPAEQFSTLLDNLSGGWKMRVALAKVLLRKPEVLLLDEPTNHLDLESLIWLEKFLMDYSSAVLIISHDRYFLDRLVTHIGEIEYRQMTLYTGNYTTYETDKEVNREIRTRQAKNQSRQIAQTERFIERFRYKNTLATRVQSKIRELEKTDRIEVPESTRKKVKFAFPEPRRSGLVVMEMKNIDQSYGQAQVYKNMSFRIERGEKIALVGPNGAGKSTLMKLLAKTIPYQSGSFTVGFNVDVNYYAQHQLEVLNPESTVLATVESVAEGMAHTQLRSYLGTFLFSGDDVDKWVKVLSGGEKARLVLAKLLLKPANLLLMDEPTNHLDIPSQDVLISAMQHFSGSLVCISHDRRFLNAVCNKVVEVISGKLTEYPGNYDYFLWKKMQIRETDREIDYIGPKKIDGELTYEERKALQRAEQRKARNIQKIESEITSLEEKINSLESEMNQPDVGYNPKRLQKILNNITFHKVMLDKSYQRWAEEQDE